jgi:hypothetical protein
MTSEFHLVRGYWMEFFKNHDDMGILYGYVGQTSRPISWTDFTHQNWLNPGG